MEQETVLIPQHYQRNTMNQQPGISDPFTVIDQQPSRRDVFPYVLHADGILIFSILKCFFGSCLFMSGIGNTIFVKFYPLLGIGIWSGLTILANGITGCVLKYKQSKCLIGAFFALSIASLVFDVSMLSYYSLILDYYINRRYLFCYYYNGNRFCLSRLTRGSRSLGIGISSFLISLAAFELLCSIGSVVLSSKAYCKCCSTCDVNDCSTCVGCCECDTTLIKNQQEKTIVEIPEDNKMEEEYQIDPCPECINFDINVPAYLFSGTNGTQISACSLKVEAATLNQ